jgi:hypothetical protein
MGLPRISFCDSGDGADAVSTQKVCPIAAGPPRFAAAKTILTKMSLYREPQGAVSVETTAHGRGSIATAHGITLGGEESSK